MATTCQDSKCEKGGDNVCCHECQFYGECESMWKCDEPKFYKDCKENGGVVEMLVSIFAKEE